MQINYQQGKGLALYFPAIELKVALGILKAIYTISKLAFVKEAIDDLEDDLLPRKLPFTNYFHWCVKCGRDIDERDENTMRISHEGDVKWQCRKCKPLKIKRPN